MTDDPVDEFLDANGGLAELIDLLATIWEAVPLVVWVILAIVIVKLINDFVTAHAGRGTTVPSEDEWADDRQREGPSRDRYTIHDDLVADRTYQTPSESDPIEATSEVDRSLLGKIRRLARLGARGSRDGE